MRFIAAGGDEHQGFKKLGCHLGCQQVFFALSTTTIFQQIRDHVGKKRSWDNPFVVVVAGPHRGVGPGDHGTRGRVWAGDARAPVDTVEVGGVAGSSMIAVASLGSESEQARGVSVNRIESPLVLTALAFVVLAIPCASSASVTPRSDPQERGEEPTDAPAGELGRALGMTPAEVEALGLSPDEMQRLLAGFTEEAVVVGSRARPRSATESAVPVDVLAATDLVSQGAGDLKDQLRTIVPSFNTNTQPISGGSTVVRPAMLRNLAPDHTLILVNGKRRHRSSIVDWHGGNGVAFGSQAPDISAIPAIALRQIEVLRDGAAAQYGSDAIAGVMNFQLKHARSGGCVELNTGMYRAADGESAQLAGNVGRPLGATGFANLSLSTAAIARIQREYPEFIGIPASLAYHEGNPPPAVPTIGPVRGIARLTATPHAARIDRSTSRRADREYCDGAGPILWARQSPPGALAPPSPHPLAVDSPKSRPQRVPGPELPPVGGTRGVRHRWSTTPETGQELWPRLVPPRQPADDTGATCPTRNRVHVRSWATPSVDLDLNSSSPARCQHGLGSRGCFGRWSRRQPRRHGRHSLSLPI